MKFIELGIGNKWLLRTETEMCNGKEFEEKGVKGPIKFQSFYLRMWIRKSVFIIDSSEGLKKQKKNRNELKIIIGIKSL